MQVINDVKAFNLILYPPHGKLLLSFQKTI